MTSKLYKIVLIGDVDVGKSSLYVRFRDNRFIEILRTTAGMDNCKRTVTYTDSSGTLTEGTLNLWDTAGMERAGSLTSNYYLSTHAIFLCYDVTEPGTLSSLKNWMNEATRYTRDSPVLYFLIGNKLDLNHEIQVSEETAKNFAESVKIPTERTFRISVKSGTGVDHMFSKAFNLLAKAMAPSQHNPDVALGWDTAQENESKNCPC